MLFLPRLPELLPLGQTIKRMLPLLILTADYLFVHNGRIDCLQCYHPSGKD